MTGAPDWGHATPFDDINGAVAIAGIGETAYTKASGRTARDIGAEAAERAIVDAGLQPEDIDGLTYSGAFADFDVAAFHEHFGTTHELWSSPWGGGMSWAGTAPYLAARAIEQQKARHVLNVFPVAWATQRASMTGGPGEVHATQTAKQNLEVPFGWFPQPVYFATIMRRHMLEFGTTEAQFGAVAVACRRHANLNPGAVMHDKKMAIDDYLASPYLADPLRLFDSCLISDGGAAYVTTSVERAADLPHPPAVVRGVAEGLSASGTHWSQQRDFTSTPQVFSAPPAFAMAGVTPDDVDVLAVYDPFTVVSLMQIEDMGFCPKGEAGRFVEGDTLFHDAGKLPFNPHGGLLSHVYVLGIAHVVELVKQLRGTAAAQVPDCEIAVYGGYTGAHASTLVLARGRSTVAIKRADFPLPDLEDPLTAEFFAGAARGELMIPRCTGCDAWVWYPEEQCPSCAGSLEWHATSGNARLFSWAVVQRPFLPAFAEMVPFVTALVALEEAPEVRIVTYVVDVAPEALTADLPLGVTFRPLAFPTVPDRSVVVPMFTTTG